MSYSRWSNSVWYTFWAAYSGETKDEQVFTICLVKDFTYKKLKEDIDSCLDIACKDRTEEQREELREYMDQFIKDVEEENDEQA